MQSIAQKEIRKPPIMRQYDIGGIIYTVKASTKAGVKEDAATKVRRMIRKDISGMAVK